MKNRIFRRLLLAASLLLVAALCASVAFVLYKTGGPIAYERHALPGAGADRKLIVILPGLIDKPQDYVTEGFVDIAKKAGISADILITDAHRYYYIRRSLIENLNENIILPAIKQGYSQIWIVGFSMGGLGSLLYAREHPDMIAGVLAIAPYLGGDWIIDEIIAAGGLQRWEAGESPFGLNFERPLWVWLKGRCGAAHRKPSIYLGYSADDERVNRSNDLLAGCLPQERVYRVYGGHEWEPWRKIFSMFLKEIK